MVRLHAPAVARLALVTGALLVLSSAAATPPAHDVPQPPAPERRVWSLPVVARSHVLDEPVPFASRTVEDPSIETGQTALVQAGAEGVQRSTWLTATDADGRLRWTSERQVMLVAAPVEEVVAVGTRPAGPMDPASARALGAQLARERGWGEDQFGCLDKLWTRESGWKVTADNPTSSAYGIPQALPGRKMAAAGADWQTNADTQIRWGLDYVSARYGTPCKAWAHSRTHGWY